MLQVEVTVQASAGATRTLKVSVSRETVGRSSISMIKRGGSGDMRARQGGGAKVKDIDNTTKLRYLSMQKS
jgi:hypothetical protein